MADIFEKDGAKLKVTFDPQVVSFDYKFLVKKRDEAQAAIDTINTRIADMLAKAQKDLAVWQARIDAADNLNLKSVDAEATPVK